MILNVDKEMSFAVIDKHKHTKQFLKRLFCLKNGR